MQKVFQIPTQINFFLIKSYNLILIHSSVKISRFHQTRTKPLISRLCVGPTHALIIRKIFIFIQISKILFWIRVLARRSDFRCESSGFDHGFEYLINNFQNQRIWISASSDFRCDSSGFDHQIFRKSVFNR